MNKTEAVANYFIAMGLNEDEAFMSNLRLNKLMYYAQAWSLALRGKPLFDAEFEAWEHGPVIPSVYHEYKRFKKGAITELSPDFSVTDLTAEELGLLSAVMANYEKYSAIGLRDLSHESGGPWDITIKTKGRNGTIDKSLIREAFASKTPLKIGSPLDILAAVGYRDERGTLILPASWKDEACLSHA